MQKDANSAVFICPDYSGFAFTYYYNRDFFTARQSRIPKKDMVRALNSDHVFLVKNHKEVDSIYKANNFDKIIYVDAGADFSYSNNNIKDYFNRTFQGESVLVDSLYVPEIFNIYSYTLDK